MESEFGYVPVIEGNKVTFAHRYALFDDYVVKDLSDQINDYEYSVNSSLIYTSVKVGYDKQDYDSINGRDEFRFTNEFSTGLKLTDNTLSLISPYRADAYGIEFLVQKEGRIPPIMTAIMMYLSWDVNLLLRQGRGICY